MLGTISTASALLDQDTIPSRPVTAVPTVIETIVEVFMMDSNKKEDVEKKSDDRVYTAKKARLGNIQQGKETKRLPREIP